jgi:hypothetical protein
VETPNIQNTPKKLGQTVFALQYLCLYGTAGRMILLLLNEPPRSWQGRRDEAAAKVVPFFSTNFAVRAAKTFASSWRRFKRVHCSHSQPDPLPLFC